MIQPTTSLVFICHLTKTESRTKTKARWCLIQYKKADAHYAMSHAIGLMVKITHDGNGRWIPLHCACFWNIELNWLCAIYLPLYFDKKSSARNDDWGVHSSSLIIDTIQYKTNFAFTDTDSTCTYSSCKNSCHWKLELSRKHSWWYYLITSNEMLSLGLGTPHLDYQQKA